LTLKENIVEEGEGTILVINENLERNETYMISGSQVYILQEKEEDF